ncbi:MAG TPA: hypothetical protein VHO02_03300 [Fibrobacteria bacterium]|jgi:hypothetical protein|nr:hypothetical protein [Fibrobacteria bacterium]
MAESHVTNLPAERLGDKLSRSASWFLGAGILGVVLCAVSYFRNGTDFFVSYLTAFCFFLAISLGALFFVMVQHLSRSAWSVTVRRTAETLAFNLLLLAILFLPLLPGIHDLFRWTHEDVRATDALIQAKAGYLNLPFFYIRAAFYFAVWSLLSWWFLRTSRLQDETSDPALTTRMGKVSTIGLILFGLTLTFFALDWIMSIDAHWYSTMFGVYYFAGSVVAFYCSLILLVTLLKRTGHLAKSVNTEHYHDMGKLLFGHNVFWTYIGFSQFMLIWYANIPEETQFFLHRSAHGWKAVSYSLPWLHFAFPFLFLMSHNVKRRPLLLAAGCAVLLTMCYVDLYWLIQPNFHHAPTFGLSDIGALLAIGGFYLFFFINNLRQASLIPTGDPRLKDCLSYDNGLSE